MKQATSTQAIEATLLFLRKNDQILLAMKKRGFGKDWYNGVGGKLDTEETVEQAAIRECQEEIGVIPKNLSKVATLEFQFAEKVDQPQPDMNVHVYFCKEWTGQPIETEEMAPEWFDISHIPYERMWEDDPYWLPVVLTGRVVTGTFVFGQDNQLITSTVRNA
jgi:mutator protein MutT